MPTSQASISFTHRKQAITLGLSNFLTNKELEEAVNHWVEHYKDKPTFAIQRFVQDIVQTYHLESQKREITQNLITNLNHTLLVDKAKEFEHTDDAAKQATDQQPVFHAEQNSEEVTISEDVLEIFSRYYYLEAFHSIYTNLISYLPEAEKTIFFKQAISSVKKNKILKKHKDAIINLYHQGTLPESYDDMTDVLSEILNHLSFEMTKSYGAHLADEWLLESIKAARAQYTDEIVDELI